MVLGYALATLIGVSLGLLGGGGSILTVPILVYVLGMEAKLSIALSLAIVGATSLIGCISHYKKGNINLKVAGIFGPIAMAGTFLGAKIAKYMSGSTQLIVFAIIMLLASFFMFRGKKGEVHEDENAPKEMNYALIAVEGIIVGIITGIVGVGGGFLIVPALVLLAHIGMKEAVGTSLLIIALKSFAGFVGYMGQVTVPWGFLGIFIIFTGIGIIVGSKLIHYISQEKLKKVFAIFLVIMGCVILYKNKDKLMGRSTHLDNWRGNYVRVVS
jgi:uncharacterized membrane protein YfcA